MVITNYIAYILAIIGGLNWGLVGIFNFNLVDAIFGPRSVVSIIIYCLIAIACLWLIFSPIYNGRMLDLGCEYKHTENKRK